MPQLKLNKFNYFIHSVFLTDRSSYTQPSYVELTLAIREYSTIEALCQSYASLIFW